MSETDSAQTNPAAEPATEGDAAWRERTQDQTPPPDAVPRPPPPAGIGPDDNRHP